MKKVNEGTDKYEFFVSVQYKLLEFILMNLKWIQQCTQYTASLQIHSAALQVKNRWGNTFNYFMFLPEEKNERRESSEFRRLKKRRELYQ